MIHDYVQDSKPRFLEPFELEQHLQSFCIELSEAGYRQLTINGYFDSVCHFGSWLNHRGILLKCIDARTLDQFSKHKCRCPGMRRGRTLSNRYLNRVSQFVRFLVRKGMISPLPTQVPPRRSEECEAFCSWLLSERGLTTNTVVTYRRSIMQILPALGSNPNMYHAQNIRSVVTEYAQGHGTTDAKHLVSALRAFLRFIASEGRCSATLVDAVPTVPHWRLSSLPRYVSAVDLERIVDSCDTSRQTGLRDFAVLLLLARLGLRAKDIVDMAIADIDWSDATIRVCGKSRQEVRLPLPQDAGNAILDYLEHGRPDSASIRLFLCTNAPYRPFARSSTVSAIVKAAVVRAKIIDPPSSGTNLMRHSAATAMLRAGASLDAVSTILRHRSTDTTMHYAKVDIVRLNALVVPWPENSSC